MKTLFTFSLFLMLTDTFGQYLNKHFKYSDTLKTNEQTLFTGRFVQRYSNGRVQIEGQFKEGLMDSFVCFYDVKGTPVWAIIKSNDTISELKYNENGKLVLETLSTNDTPFIVKTYYDDQYNSIKSISRYRHGKLQGRSHEFYKKKKATDPSAIYVETFYHLGLKNGIECFYSEKGVPKSIACYSNDTMCYRNFYDKSGTRVSVEVNTGGKKSEKKGVPEAVCNCVNLPYKE